MGFGRRRVIPPAEAAVQDLIIRIRWERAKKRCLEPGSAGWSLVDSQERELVEELQQRFGPDNVTVPALEWLITRRLSPSPLGAERN